MQPRTERSRESGENVVIGADEDERRAVVIPPVVSVPLGGLAEIDVTLQGPDLWEGLELTVDTSTPGLVAVPGAIRRFENLGAIRIGATAPLAVGATFTLRITAQTRTRKHVLTAVSSATVVDRTGSLDPSFGVSGTFVSDVSKYDRDSFSDLQVLPDGSTLATGPHGTMTGHYLRAVHVRADGTADEPDDRTWHQGKGSVVIRLNPYDNDATAFAIRRQSTGRIILAGVDHRGGDRIALAALLPDLSIDRSFGNAGIRLLGPDAGTAAFALAVAADDALIVAGYRGRRSLVARLTPDGAPDPSFAAGGYAVFDPVYGVTSEIRAVAIDGAGRILTVGNAGPHAFIARFAPDGHDLPYPGPKLSTPEPSDEATAQAIALTPDGKTLVAGTLRRGQSSFVAAWRLLENGAPDPTFGHSPTGRGLVVIPVFGASNQLGGFTLLPDGRIVLAVNLDMRAQDDAEHAKPFLVRLLPDGSRDPMFGARGFVRVPLGQGDSVHSIGHTDDGKLVLGLRLRPGERAGQHAALARVWN